jgi:ribosome biogenesis GTPase / thiamine phosphate phosphatase
MSVPEGIVTRAIGGFFEVFDSGHTRRCRARGVFKLRGISIATGDRVRYEPIGSQEGIVEEVLPRHSQLVRPTIANVHQVLMVFSLVTPELNVQFLDRTLVAAQIAGVQSVIVLTKIDLAGAEQLQQIQQIYEQIGYPVIPVVSKQGIGVEEVKSRLTHKITVFSGPSGAGKSTLANAILPDLGAKMGEISDKIGLGKHTTRHVELYAVGDDAWIADAPGFSQLDIHVPSSELRRYFPDFEIPSEACAYRGCLHTDEGECGVKEAVGRGQIAPSRFENYQSIYHEIRDREEHKY